MRKQQDLLYEKKQLIASMLITAICSGPAWADGSSRILSISRWIDNQPQWTASPTVPFSIDSQYAIEGETLTDTLSGSLDDSVINFSISGHANQCSFRFNSTGLTTCVIGSAVYHISLLPDTFAPPKDYRIRTFNLSTQQYTKGVSTTTNDDDGTVTETILFGEYSTGDALYYHQARTLA